MLVAADILEEASCKEGLDGALGGALGESEEAFDVDAAEELAGLKVLADGGFSLVERNFGRVGLFSRSFETEFLAVGHEEFLRREDDALHGNVLRTDLAGIVDFGGGEGEGEGAEAVEAHAVAIGQVFTDDLFDGGHCGMKVGCAEGASSGNRLHDFLQRHSTFCNHSGVIALRGFRIRIGIGVEFKRDCHNGF